MKRETPILLEKRNLLTKQVYNIIRGAIIQGEFKPGERLFEVRLAEKIGVSRTPVREAIKQLTADGWLVLLPRGGVEVFRMSKKEVQDYFGVRLELERYSVRLATSKITAEIMEQLHKNVAESKKQFYKDDIDGVIKLNNSFHNIIAQTSGNAYLAEVLENILVKVNLYRATHLFYKSEAAKVIREHEELLAAFNMGEKEKAQEIVAHHIGDAKEAILSHLDEIKKNLDGIHQ